MFSNTCNILVKNTIFIEKLNDRKKYTHFSNLKIYVWNKHDINHLIQLDPGLMLLPAHLWKDKMIKKNIASYDTEITCYNNLDLKAWFQINFVLK